MNIYIDLFLSFAKVGAMTFGGGYAMLPMLKRELCDKKKWVTEDEILDSYAVGQCTPGVIAVNAATLIGSKKKGILGAVASTLGVITPSIVIILLIASLISGFGNNEYVRHAFRGISVSVCGLVTVIIYDLINKSVKGYAHMAILLFSFFSVALLGLSPVYALLGSMAFGLTVYAVRSRRH
ncbi:MAG: chromate transporter [Clostridia bacterium]|nr:chromate transporter [Clostridia bacterium]